MGRSKVALVSFEAIRPGTAPSYHVLGTLRRLAAIGFDRDDLHLVATRTGRTWKRLLKISVQSVLATATARVLIVRWHPAALLPSLLWRAAGVRVIYLVQGTTDDAEAAHPILGRVLLKKLATQSLKLAHAWAAPHEGIAKWVSLHVDDVVSVLPNGYPIHEADPRRPSAEIPDRFVLFAGALAAWQGVSTMLAAVRLPEWPEGVSLVIVGDGSLAKEALDADADSEVTYLGRRPPQEVAYLLRHSIASLSPKLLTDVTRQGISPFKLLEAGLMGAPVIASRVPGQTEYVETHHCGLLIEPGSAIELAQSVSLLSKDGSMARRLGNNGKLASAHSDWENGAHLLKALLERPVPS